MKWTAKPSEVACNARFSEARPTSCPAHRLGEPSRDQRSAATERISTGARRAQEFPEDRQSRACLSDSASSSSKTMKRHGCSLKQDGAIRAASSSVRKAIFEIRRL